MDAPVHMQSLCYTVKVKTFFTGMLKQCVSNSNTEQIGQGSCSSAGSDEGHLEWGLRYCISSKLPGDGNAAVLWTRL